MGGAVHFGVQAKALLIDTALFCGRGCLAGDGLQAQHFLSRPGPERNAVSAGDEVDYFVCLVMRNGRGGITCPGGKRHCHSRQAGVGAPRRLSTPRS